MCLLSCTIHPAHQLIWVTFWGSVFGTLKYTEKKHRSPEVFAWMSRASCKFRGKKNPDPNLYSSKKSPSKCWDVATPKFWKMAGYLKHGILHFRGATILLEIHPFFPEPNEYGRKGVNTSPTRTWKRKSRAQLKKLEKKQSNTHSAKNVSFLFSFQGWYFYMPWFVLFRVEFPSVSDSYVMFVLPFKLKFHESQWSFIPKDLTSQMILPEN